MAKNKKNKPTTNELTTTDHAIVIFPAAAHNGLKFAALTPPGPGAASPQAASKRTTPISSMPRAVRAAAESSTPR